MARQDARGTISKYIDKLYEHYGFTVEESLQDYDADYKEQATTKKFGGRYLNGAATAVAAKNKSRLGITDDELDEDQLYKAHAKVFKRKMIEGANVYLNSLRDSITP